MMMQSPRSPRKSQNSVSSSRIPETLQAVFIASNRGREVNKPPPAKVAFKSFPRGGFRKSLSISQMHVERRRSSNASSSGQNSEVGKSLMQEKSLLPIPVAFIPSGESYISPQAYVTSVLKTRGYSTNTFSAVATAYHNKATAIQTASYGKYLVRGVREDDAQTLSDLFQLGISPNACNQHGESIVHTACRLGKINALRVMIEHGCVLSVADDYGRTPMHDACWQNENPNFDIVEILLEHDSHLLYINDSRGSGPLSYVPREKWNEWTRFFMAKKDKIWPMRDIKKEGFMPDSERSQKDPNTMPIYCNAGGLSFDMVAMVAEGSMDPSDATYCKYDRRLSSTEFTCEDSYSGSSDEDDDSSDSESETDEDYTEMDDDCSDCTFDEEEMAEILGSIGSMKPIRWSNKSQFEL
eukprot:CAMPEP_0198144980 /NCGR_PEP_ID=MMETSP1443-20131203/20098_1 /TAXON_ID=186043 /ORGANISM="Entomoneis sp., Strain CCMP2396" /LENGTH=410 /DNA_ID=CAMNT_0043808489 /DNA_START=92 /DNA_END=1324 /DNA_ORIENTATION=+